MLRNAGSYVRFVNVQAHFFLSACAALHLIDVQGRRQGDWTTVDPALIRGFYTA